MGTENLARLDRIYRLYAEQTGSLDLACRKYCADCCTADVTLTRLEGAYILDALDDEGRAELFARLAAHGDSPRFQPRMTTNGFAAYCNHGAPPEDAAGSATGPCPLLSENACTIYPQRPFGCRCMISARPCRETGEARIDPFTLTLNTVFLQLIEHLDKDGFFGNLNDVLCRLDRSDAGATIPCQPLSALMVPPEHRDRIRPVLDALNERTTER